MKIFYSKSKFLTALIIILISFNSVYAQTVVYVSSDGAGDGSSWATATADVQAAINAATAGTEIWIKAGTYYTLCDTGIYLKDQVSLYGGFAGTEADKTERTDYGLGGTNETILSGDVDENGILDAGNANNVIRGFEISSATIIDGFTISDGYADDANGDGGGMYLQTASPTIMNCTFTNNYCLDNGAAIYERTGSEPAIISCFFIANHANEDAGGVYMQNADITPYVGNCVFVNNTAGDQGGAIWINHCSAIVANCTFVYNEAINQNGGAIRLYLSSSQSAEVPPTSPTLLNNVFWRNKAPEGETTDIEISDVAFGTITNCAFGGTSDTVENVVVTDAMDLSSTDPLFTNAVADSAGYAGYNAASDWSLQEGSPLINAGVLVGSTETDILGNTRDANPDIGAYEYMSENVNIENVAINEIVKVFPNPTTGRIYVSCVNNDLSEITVFNITGCIVERISNITNEGIISIDLNNKVSGVYFIKVMDRSGNGITKKIILN